MICLAMDTAGTACAACLYDMDSKTVLAELSEDIGRGHAERLMGIVSEVMNKAGVGYSDLGRVVTTTGPGSFTGIRVSVATAKGFGLGLGIPVVGVSNLQGMLAVARQMAGKHDGGLHGAILDARRGEIYGMLDFDTDFAEAGTAFICDAHEFSNMIARLVQAREPANLVLAHLPGHDPETMAAMPHVKLLPLDGVPISLFARIGSECEHKDCRAEPLYLRQPDATPTRGFAVERIRG